MTDENEILVLDYTCIFFLNLFSYILIISIFIADLFGSFLWKYLQSADCNSGLYLNFHFILSSSSESYSIAIILDSLSSKQAEKLKSREMKEGWMKNDEGWMKNEWKMMKDEEWMMKDDDFKLLRGFADWRTDICDYRVAFATENCWNIFLLRYEMNLQESRISLFPRDYWV